VRRLQAGPDRPVGEALLDQRNLAGIGNFYKSEVLFLRGLDPWRPVGSVDDLEALVELARKLLDANKDRAGQITTGNPARGQESWVYGRPGRPCRRCGAAIRTARHAGQHADPEDRVTFWCPRCQRLRIPRLGAIAGRGERLAMPDGSPVLGIYSTRAHQDQSRSCGTQHGRFAATGHGSPSQLCQPAADPVQAIVPNRDRLGRRLQRPPQELSELTVPLRHPPAPGIFSLDSSHLRWS